MQIGEWIPEVTELYHIIPKEDIVGYCLGVRWADEIKGSDNNSASTTMAVLCIALIGLAVETGCMAGGEGNLQVVSTSVGIQVE